MLFLRFLLLAFNAAVITFLVYELIRIARLPIPSSRKWLVFTAGIILLLAPLSMLLRLVPGSLAYFLIYPIAISLFIYLTRKIDA